MKWELLCCFAQELAQAIPGFFDRKGPGVGDRATADFIRSLRALAHYSFGYDHSERAVCSAAGFRFDYYFPDEMVVVELAFGLHNPMSEFERDIFKCLLAQEDGFVIEKLVLMGKPGAIAKLSAPAPKAIMAFVKKRFDLEVDVLELQIPPDLQPKTSPVLLRTDSTT